MKRNHVYHPSFGEQLSLLDESPKLGRHWDTHHTYYSDMASIDGFGDQHTDFEVYSDRQSVDSIEVSFKGSAEFETHRVKIIGEPLPEATNISGILKGVIQTILVDKSQGS